MHQNRLFNRPRVQLTGFYASAIGLITLISGCAIHLVMIWAFERTVNRELDTLAGTVHDTLEAVLQQPEMVNPVAIKLLPGLCVVGKKCLPVKSNAKIGVIFKLLNLLIS